jgi:hypothetical protein
LPYILWMPYIAIFFWRSLRGAKTAAQADCWPARSTSPTCPVGPGKAFTYFFWKLLLFK